MSKNSKAYREAAEKVDRERLYTPLEAAKLAASAAVDQILDGTWFSVVAGTHQAYLAFPPVRTGTGMVRMDARARFEAHQAIDETKFRPVRQALERFGVVGVHPKVGLFF